MVFSLTQVHLRSYSSGWSMDSNPWLSFHHHNIISAVISLSCAVDFIAPILVFSIWWLNSRNQEKFISHSIACSWQLNSTSNQRLSCSKRSAFLVDGSDKRSRSRWRVRTFDRSEEVSSQCAPSEFGCFAVIASEIGRNLPFSICLRLMIRETQKKRGTLSLREDSGGSSLH